MLSSVTSGALPLIPALLTLHSLSNLAAGQTEETSGDHAGGCGDFGDVGRAAVWAFRAGVDFVAIINSIV